VHPRRPAEAPAALHVAVCRCARTRRRAAAWRDQASALAVPVLEVVAAAQHVVLAARPDPDLVAVRVLRDPELVLRREKRDTDELLRVVARVVRAVRAGGEADRVAGL